MLHLLIKAEHLKIERPRSFIFLPEQSGARRFSLTLRAQSVIIYSVLIFRGELFGSCI